MLRRLDRLHQRLHASLAKALPIVPFAVLDLCASLIIAVPLGWLAYSEGFVIFDIVVGMIQHGVLALLSNEIPTVIVLRLLMAPILMMLYPTNYEDEDLPYAYKLEAVGVILALALVWTTIHLCLRRRVPVSK